MTANTAQTQHSGISEAPLFGDVCLLGLGVTGRAVLDYFISHPEQYHSLAVFGASAAERDAYKALYMQGGSTVYPDAQEVVGSYDITIASPGIPPHDPLFRSAQRCSQEIISEPELAWRLSPQRWIAITGTNGKTTTTTLVAHLLETAGVAARTAGNIGTPCIEAIVQRADDEYLAVELSSYQLFSTVQFAPDIAILLAITPDHLSWHGTHEAYVLSKLKLLQNIDKQALAVIDAGGETTRAAILALRDAGHRVVGIGTSDGLYSSMVKRCGAANAAYVAPGSHILTVELDEAVHTLCHAADLKLRGTHNLTNALAASTAALSLGVSCDDIIEGLKTFEALEHRFEPCGEVRGVRFFNDSKATNTDAAIKAVEAFGDDEGRRVIALFGGSDKGTELDDLICACSRNCHTVICYGEAAKRFYDAFCACEAFRVIQVEGFVEACAAAIKVASQGDIVLLSPACASFDEFSCFEARGTAFKEFVSSLGKEAGRP